MSAQSNTISMKIPAFDFAKRKIMQWGVNTSRAMAVAVITSHVR